MTLVVTPATSRDGARPRRWWQPPPLRTGRIVGLDIARAIALISMILVHTNSAVDAQGQARWWWELSVGRCAALFAVLAGVGLALITGGYAKYAGRELLRRRFVLLNRALMIFAVGLALGQLDTYVRVILCMYATIFLIAQVMIDWPLRRLIAAATAWTVLGPLIWMWLSRHHFGLPDTKENLTVGMLADPGHALNVLFITGNYPVLVWVAYVIVGMAVGRLDLLSWRSQWVLTLLGLFLWRAARALDERAPLASPHTWGTQLHDNAHTGTICDLVNTIGFSLLVIGLSLMAARLAPRFFSILAGAGTMALTLYAVHILLTLPSVAPLLPGPPFPWHLGVFLSIGCYFGWVQRQGPLEEWVARTSTWVGHKVVPD